MIFLEKADDVVRASFAVTGELLKQYIPENAVIIKPNIVTPDPPPTTTDVRVADGIIKALKEYGVQAITIAEGSGTGDTIENLHRLGYSKLGVGMVDLDREKTVQLPVNNHRVWKEILFPEILLNKFIISVPVLKEHSMCGATISLKNMVGVLPAKYYSGYWSYKKSQIHRHDTHGCISDIVSVMRPHWAIVDATIGMRGSHIGGVPIKPPINLVYSSNDAVEADRFGCQLLGMDWKEVHYLQIISAL